VDARPRLRLYAQEKIATIAVAKIYGERGACELEHLAHLPARQHGRNLFHNGLDSLIVQDKAKVERKKAKVKRPPSLLPSFCFFSSLGLFAHDGGA
jgi:hypothetical protein